MALVQISDSFVVGDHNSVFGCSNKVPLGSLILPCLHTGIVLHAHTPTNDTHAGRHITKACIVILTVVTVTFMHEIIRGDVAQGM